MSCVYAQVREHGVWKNIPLNPGVGRIVDVEFDPNDGDRLYAAPDANGIWYTENLGKHWECITDNIPNVDARVSDNEIIVDPDNFDKIYYVSKYGHYYITENRGKSWREVKDKDGKPVKLTDFKRSLIAHDKKTGKTIMVCTTIGRDHGKKSANWVKGLHTSHDEGQTWIHHKNKSKDDQYLEVAFHPENPYIVYASTFTQLLKSEDGGLTFNSILDFKGPKGSFSDVKTIPTHPEWIYLITSSKRNRKVKNDTAKTALYLSKDAGKTWETIQDMSKGIGFNKSVYNGDFVGSWLHCFAINPNNTNEMYTAHNNMMVSQDGGKTWTHINWSHRPKSRLSDGSIVTNMYGKHIADSHVLKFHPKYKSRIYKVSDSGFYVKDPEIGFDDWVNISGDMQNMLFYSVKVNEFGDRYITGNTQDCDIQTYQYGKWQWARGYEGDVVFIHPYTNTGYFPYSLVGEATEIKGLFNLDKYNNAQITSWGRPQIAVNYRNPNENIILYKTKNSKTGKKVKMAFHIKDKNKTADTLMVAKEGDIFYANISRTKEERFTLISSSNVYISKNRGKKWKIRKTPSTKVTFGAVDPENPDRIWIGTKKGKVFESTNGGKDWESLSTNLPKGAILKLIYHEGSERDLYALVAEGDGQFMRPRGVYYLGENSKKWTPWMKGFKLQGFSDIVIDYPSQKLLASSYGRGVWEADLQNICERFLTETPDIKQVSDYENRLSFTIKTEYHLPDYYNFKWSVNGIFQGRNSQYFTHKSLNKGDKIRCIISPKYSPDIVLKTKTFKVKKIKKFQQEDNKGYITNESGFADLGYYDYFKENQNFTIELKLNPKSEGVIIGNRRLNEHDAKGFILHIKDSMLVLNYSEKYNTVGGFDRGGKNTPRSTKKLSCDIDMNKWNDIKISFNRNGKASISINNKECSSVNMNNLSSGVSFNSLYNLCIFADATGDHKLKGCIDEIRISDTNTIFYHSFDNKLSETKEYFTQNSIKIKGDITIKYE